MARAPILLMLPIVALAACARPFVAADPRVDPGAQLAAYAIAHGMAVGYSDSAAADPAVVGQLLRLDTRAMTAIVQGGDSAAAARAVAALTKLAAGQTAPEPAPEPVP